MARQQYSPTKAEVLGPTEARQANRKKMNLRVLIFSMGLIIAIFAILTVAFFNKTPPAVDGSSGPQPSSTQPVTPSQP